MPTLTELRQDVLARPAEDAPRLAYAAACDTEKDPQGQFIRVQIRLLNARSRDVDGEEERDRLLEQYESTWASGVAPSVERWEFDRGFVGLVRLSAGAFLQKATELYAKAPILHLELIAPGKDTAAALAQGFAGSSTAHIRVRSTGSDGSGPAAAVISRKGKR